MGSSRGRRTAAYIAARRYFRQTKAICWLCNERPGTTVDHHPPLHLYPNEQAWAANGGQYRPACPTCQSRQGADIVNQRKRKPSRQW